MTKKQTTTITILTVVAFIFAMLVSGRYWFRLDLTANRAHTISQVSRNLHRELSDPVHITFFLSNRLRTVLPEPGEIEDLLREYAAHSRGRIRLTVRDPLRVGLDTVERLGLQPRQMPIVEQDQTSLVTVYSGIVIEYLDQVSVIPWVISTETLEYDITFRILSMVRDTERWLAVMIGDSFRWWEEFGFLDRTLQDAGYRVRLISPGDEIPDNTPALFVFGGAEELDEWTLFQIDRYIQQGGSVLFGVEGVFVDTTQGTLDAWRYENPMLLNMIASYGVFVLPELALDRNALMIQYQAPSPFTGRMTMRIARYPLWISVSGENMNSAHPVSSGLANLDLFWASPLELHTVPGVESTVLFTSSQQSWSMRDAFHTNPELTHLMEVEAWQTAGQKILGVSLSGTFPSFFEGLPKPVRLGSEEELPDMPEYARPARIIVVGDTDFASNLIGVTQAGHNLDFLLRAADWLTSDDDIIAIRNRQTQTGRFDRIADPDRRSSVMRFVQILNVGLIPLLVIVAGLIRASRRTRAIRLSIADTTAQDDGSVNKEGGDDL